MQDVSRGQAPGDTGSLRCRRPCRRRGCSWGGSPGSGGPYRMVVRGSAGRAAIWTSLRSTPASKHGRDECVAEHVRMGSGDLDAGGFGESPQTAGGRVPVHPGAAAVEQDRPARAVSDRPVDGPADRGRQRDQDDLGALAAHAQHPVAVLLSRGRRCPLRWPRRSAGRAARAWPPVRSRTGSVIPGRR